MDIHVDQDPRVKNIFYAQITAYHEIILLINVKMSTIVGILTFISRINTLFECIKQEINL